MSDADNPQNDLPLQPPADPTVPLSEPTAAAPEPPQFAPPPAESPEPPTEQYAAQHFPTEPVPTTVPQFPPAAQFPAAEAPTTQVPTMAPAPSSVVLSTNSPAAPKKKGALAWALAGIATVAAVVFAILWVGKSGDADDLSSERDALVVDKSTLEQQLSTAEADLESTQGELESTSSDLEAATAKAADLESEIDDLSTQVTDLTSELEAAQNRPAEGAKAVDYAPGLSLGLGKALGENADPALSDDEALCLGSNILDVAGVDLLFIDYFEDVQPTPAQENTIGRAFLQAADVCNIPFDRLNL